MQQNIPRQYVPSLLPHIQCDKRTITEVTQAKPRFLTFAPEEY